MMGQSGGRSKDNRVGQRAERRLTLREREGVDPVRSPVFEEDRSRIYQSVARNLGGVIMTTSCVLLGILLAKTIGLL